MHFDFVFCTVIVIIAGCAFATLSCYVGWRVCTSATNKKDVRDFFIATAIGTFAASFLCWFSYQPYSGVTIPNVFRILVLVLFALGMVWIVSGNIRRLIREDRQFAA